MFFACFSKTVTSNCKWFTLSPDRHLNDWWSESLLPSSSHPGPSLNPVPAMHVFPSLLQDVPKTRSAFKRRLESVSHCVNILIDVPLSCNGRVCLQRHRTRDSSFASSLPVLLQHNQVLELLSSHSARVSCLIAANLGCNHRYTRPFIYASYGPF